METCCEKPSVNIDVKNSKGINNNNNEKEWRLLLRSARILRRVLEIKRDLLSLKLQ